MEPTKHVLDGISFGAAFAAFLGYLPAVAAAISIIWYGIRFYEYFKNKKVVE